MVGVKYYMTCICHSLRGFEWRMELVVITLGVIMKQSKPVWCKLHYYQTHPVIHALYRGCNHDGDLWTNWPTGTQRRECEKAT